MKMVILGGGFAGLNAAIRLGEKLQDSEHEVVLISDKPEFLFRPSLVWVSLNERETDDITLSLSENLSKVGVSFIQKRVVSIDPNQNKVYLKEDIEIDYDYLIIATGAKPDYTAVEGLDATSCIYDAEGALRTREKISTLGTNIPIVIGVAQGNPNPWLVYEFMFELEAYLKKLHKQFYITFFTYEKEVFSYFTDKGSKRIEQHLHDKKISYYSDVKLEKLENDVAYLSDGSELPYEFSLIAPSYKGVEYVFNLDPNSHKSGLLYVNDFLESLCWDNVYVVGDANLTPHEPVVKNGRAAEIQGRIAVDNILRKMSGKKQKRKYKESLLGLMDLGTDGGLFTAKLPSEKFPLIRLTADGNIPHWMKVLFEKHYLKKLSKGK